MKKKAVRIFSISSIVCGFILAASFLLSGFAQKKNETPKAEDQNQVEQNQKARREIAKSVVGSLLLDVVSVKEPSWILVEAGYSERDQNNKRTLTGVSFRKEDTFLSIDISEYDSVEDAEARFSSPRSYGASVSSNLYGDRGEILVGNKGDFMAIRFRKDRFFVAVFCRDQKTAERFAGYALEAIGDR